METEFQIVEIPQESALEIFTTPKGLEPYLNRITLEVEAFVPDLTTDKGRKEIASIAHRVARSKSAIDGVGKQVVDELKKQPKLVDAERKRAREYLDALKEKVRQPLTEWEQKEQLRIKAHEMTLQALSDLAVIDRGESLENIESALSTAREFPVGSELDEYQDRGELIKAGTIHTLETALKAAQQREAERIELAALREEMQQREAREAEEREKREAKEAEERKQREAEAAEQRRIQAEKDAAAQAERDELARRAQAAEYALAEQERIKREADEKAEREIREAEEKEAREKAGQAEREANEAHIEKINKEAEASIYDNEDTGFSRNEAEMIVNMIVAGEIRHVSITY